MPIFRLSSALVFPPAALADESGLLAVGGDLAPERLLLAYSSGIFPWFSPGDPLLWWSPDPRCLLEFPALHISRSLAKVLRRQRFRVSFNRAFAAVIGACAEERERSGEGTWIGPEMQAAYLELHRRGYAHSVECWQGEELVGGLYGVSLGRGFFGESMFHRRTDASKVAFVQLARRLAAAGFAFLDCQLPTPHLASLGARQLPRAEFLARLLAACGPPSVQPDPGPFLTRIAASP
jgi:leucyl/phenylalanyl-tRNA---protein transferase